MYRIQFDKTYLNGPMAGLTMPDQSEQTPSRAEAEHALQFYQRAEAGQKPLWEIGTNTDYTVANPALSAETVAV